jgi:hypothetical protein
MKKQSNNLGSGLPALNRNDDGAGREMVLSRDMVVAPNIELSINSMSGAAELYMRRMEMHNDLSIKPARGK